jgi:DNA polymerase (family 10)
MSSDMRDPRIGMPAGPRANHRSIARVLREVAFFLQLKGENPFKTRAYETAAARFEELPQDALDRLLSEGRLTDLPGVGEAIAKKVTALAQTGALPLHEALRQEFPPGLLELARVPDLGPKRIAALHRELGVASLEALRRACEEARVRGLAGFGEKIEAKILEGLRALERASPRRPLGEVRPIAAELVQTLAGAPGVVRAEAAGSVRRFRETVGDLDIVVAAPSAAPVFDAVAEAPGAGRVLARGDTKCSVVFEGGLQVDVRVVSPEQFATALHHFTGSKAHHVRLRSLARERGLKISEWGVEREDGTLAPVQSEAQLYEVLGMQEVPPELREDQGEVEAALQGALPRLVEAPQVRGFVHLHTTWSDGKDDLVAMAEAVRARGGGYLAVTDHSRSAGYAGGLDLERLRAQAREIDEIQGRFPDVVLLKGAEVDILEDGRLDYPDEVLAELDVVIGSVHSRLRLDEEAMTRRLLRALENPFLDVLGHPTGRLLGQRDPSPFDLDAVLAAASRSGTAVEVNGSPERLDLGAEQVRRARELEVPLVLATDAHSTAGLSNLEYAVATARRGWAGPIDVLNCLEAEDFCAAIREGRRRRRG